MRRRSTAWYSLCSLLGLGGLVLFLGGCADNQVGRICNNPSGASVTSGVTFVNPAPDCPSRLCMITPKAPTSNAEQHRTAELSICTAECNTDADCANPNDDGSLCSRFVCAVPSVLPGEENFCCKKLCMCDDDRAKGFNTDGDGPPLCRDPNGVPIPKFCLPPEKGGPQSPNGQRNCPIIQPNPSSC